MSMDKKAVKIAEILTKTKVENRGDLLIMAGACLRERFQYFTGKLLQDLGELYNKGLKE